jgi:arylformamidase
MKISLQPDTFKYTADLSKPIDISIPLISGSKGPKCFYAPDFIIEPVVAGDFIGSTDCGSPVNFKNIHINPHGNGTHTECVGHITMAPFTIHECLKEFHFISQLITVTPIELENGDLVITKELIQSEIDSQELATALVIRTLPNNDAKLNFDYSGTNPPYFDKESIRYIRDKGILHLITDLPSLDREEDGGALSGHKTFWGFPDEIDPDATVTEMVYIADHIRDGMYLCNIQIAPVMGDASPSKVVLFELESA